MFFPDADRNIFPVGPDNIAVGRVTEVGSSVNMFKLFDHVSCHTNCSETITLNEDSADLRRLPEGASWYAAVSIDPAVLALGAI